MTSSDDKSELKHVIPYLKKFAFATYSGPDTLRDDRYETVCNDSIKGSLPSDDHWVMEKVMMFRLKDDISGCETGQKRDESFNFPDTLGDVKLPEFVIAFQGTRFDKFTPSTMETVNNHDLDLNLSIIRGEWPEKASSIFKCALSL